MKRAFSFIQAMLSNEFAKKSIYVLLLRLVGVVFLFGVTLIITNNFNDTLVGEYDLSRSVLFLVGGICVLGFNQSIIYYAGRLKSKDSLNQLKFIYYKMLRAIVIISISLGLLFLLTPSHMIDAFFEKPVYIFISKTVYTLVFFALTIINIEAYRALDKIIISEVFRNLFRHVLFLVFLIAILFYNKLELLVDVFLLSYVFIGVISTVILIVKFNNVLGQSNLESIPLRSILGRSLPMSVSSISFLIMQSIDVIFIGKFLEIRFAAYYAVAVKLTLMIALALSSVNAVYASKISELFALNDITSLKQHLKKASRLIFIITTPAILVLVLFSKTLLGYFGIEYQMASTALVILLVGQVFNALCGSVGMYMDMTGKQKIFQKIIVIALVVNIVLNWVLIPKYGMIGAAFATALSTILWNVFGAAYLLKVNKIKTFLH